MTSLFIEECFMKILHGMWLVTLVSALATPAPVRALDPKYLPNDTEIVFTINLKQILDSELLKANKEAVEHGKTALENQAGDNPLMKYLKSAGFDIFRDLQSITVANNGGKEPTAIIIEGTFDPAKFKATAEEAAKANPDALKISRAAGQTIYEISPPGDKKAFATLINGKVLYAAMTREELADAVGRVAGTKTSNLNKDYAVLLDTVNNKQSVSFVATGAALSKLTKDAPIPNGDAAAAVLQSIDGLSGAITVGKEVEFQIGVNAKDEATAKKMAQDGNGMLLGVKFLVGQQATKDERLAPLVDIAKTLRLDNQGSNVLLRGTVSLDVIEKLMKNVPQ
jgi:hypothetical protein